MHIHTHIPVPCVWVVICTPVFYYRNKLWTCMMFQYYHLSFSHVVPQQLTIVEFRVLVGTNHPIVIRYVYMQAWYIIIMQDDDDDDDLHHWLLGRLLDLFVPHEERGTHRTVGFVELLVLLAPLLHVFFVSVIHPTQPWRARSCSIETRAHTLVDRQACTSKVDG